MEMEEGRKRVKKMECVWGVCFKEKQDDRLQPLNSVERAHKAHYAEIIG